ncbi:helix-turn-helix domain-containing protein [Methylotenera sp. G11]|uniref:helix-turn-helix domain-containing protein n=1 Tax=Methylotenera sp. G11 TaxID=1506585 RepID=UPI000649270A|nr:helix-turn-helix domain-containing protein [Methylotenera sp. G11]
MHLATQENIEACFSTNEVAKKLKVSQKHLINLRKLGTGPAYFRVGNLVRYSADSIDNFINGQKNGV